jgi:hypothetical protein
MKHFFTQFFVALGVIFFIIIVIGIYFFITDPYNLKPLIFGSSPVPAPAAQQTNDTKSTSESTTDTGTPEAAPAPSTGGFQLSEAQQQALISLGIDPAAVPSSISPEQETCFVSVLGEARVAEIRAGAVPNAVEFLKAKACI